MDDVVIPLFYSCWFFFDGEFVVDIVISFIVPKLALTAVSHITELQCLE